MKIKSINNGEQEKYLDKLKIYIPIIIIGVAIAIVIFGFPQYSNQLNILVLSSTLLILLLYAFDTHRIANESVLQTELETSPIMCLYIRYISGIGNENEKQSVKEKYSITHHVGNGIVASPFYFAIRNMGNGPAFNVEVESDNFKTKKYQTRFFAPRNDEHAIKIVKKPSNKIRNLEELKNEIFTISCQSVSGKIYKYKYKINDVAEREVEFVK